MGPVTTIGWVLFYAAIAVGVACVVSMFVRGYRYPTARMQVDGGSLSATMPKLLDLLVAVPCALFGLALLMINSGQWTARGAWGYLQAIIVVEIFVLATGAMCWYVAKLVAAPGVVIRPDGVQLRGLRQQSLVTWAGLEADHDALHDAGLRGVGTTNRPAPHTPGVYSLRGLGVEPSHIVHVISYYLTHPQHRAQIGKRDEYDRILEVMAPGVTAPALDRGVTMVDVSE